VGKKTKASEGLFVEGKDKPLEIKKPIYKSLFFQIILAIVIGITIGAVWPDAGSALKPLGDGFIKLIKMVIAPLIFLVIVTGISHVGDAKAVGRVGTKALVYFLSASVFALLFGLLVGNIVKPGAGLNIDPSTLDPNAIAKKTAGGEAPSGAAGFILDIIPDSVVGAFANNTLLQVLFFAIFVGVAVVAIGQERCKPVLDVFDSFLDIVFKIMGWIMRVAPLGALGAMAYIIGQYGLKTLGTYAVLIASCYGAAAIFIVLLFFIAWLFARVPLGQFIKYARPEFALALGTASTEAVMPQVMAKLEKSGNPRSVTGLVVPLGYSFNLDGAALYLSISLLFLAQAFGVNLTFSQQLAAMGVLMLTSKGMAGVPGSSFLALSATATALGIFPVAGVALLLGADRIMDSMRVSVNLLGNCVATFVVSNWEKVLDHDQMRATFASKNVDLVEIDAEEDKVPVAAQPAVA
jgi:aerobic C4-dicarboxylate transport protein